MKRFLPALSVLAFSSGASLCRANPVIDATLLRQVELKPAPGSPDESFLALSRAGQVNFIADDSQGRKAAAVPTGDRPQHDTLLELMVDLAQQHRLSQLRYDARTFLFWPEPDVVALAKQIVAGKGVHPQGEVLGSYQMGTAIGTYLVKERGWDGQTADAGIRVPLSDVPPALRQQLQDYTVSQTLSRESTSRAWLSDEFWEGARLWLGIPRGGRGEQLLVSGIVDPETGKVESRPLSFAPLAPREPEAPTTAPAQTPAQQAAEQAALQAPALPIDKDAALSIKVSLEAKQQSLRDLLNSLQKQSGVKLQLAPGAGTALKVTARVSQLPLSALMGALGRLFEADWQPNGEKTYLFQPRQLSEMQKQMSRLGEFQWYRFRYNNLRSPENRMQRGNALAQQIREEVGAAALRRGVAFTALNTDTQEAIQGYFQEILGRDIVGLDQYLVDSLDQSAISELRVEVPSDLKAQAAAQRASVIPSARLFNAKRENFLSVPLAGLRLPDAAPEVVAPTASAAQ